MEGYSYLFCECGGHIGCYNRKTFTCEQCEKEYELYKLDYDVIMVNEKTGWQFPMKSKQEANRYE